MVGIGFFKIEILAIESVFTLLLALATVDMGRVIAFIRIEKNSPAQQQKNRRHCCIEVFLLRLTYGPLQPTAGFVGGGCEPVW